jgi:hypothetical protein
MLIPRMLLINAATVLGKTGEADEYKKLLEGIKFAFMKRVRDTQWPHGISHADGLCAGSSVRHAPGAHEAGNSPETGRKCEKLRNPPHYRISRNTASLSRTDPLRLQRSCL